MFHISALLELERMNVCPTISGAMGRSWMRKARAEHCADCAGEVLSVMKGILSYREIPERWDAAMCQGPSQGLGRSGGHGSEKWPRLDVSSRESTSESGPMLLTLIHLPRKFTLFGQFAARI